LAQRAVAEKSNEITAIPDLLGLLDLRGAVVSTDAMGCQKTIARTIVEGGADYVLALKDNPPTLCEDVQRWLDTEVARGRLPVQETVEQDHGRMEIRRSALSSRPTGSMRNRTGPGCKRSAGWSSPGSSAIKSVPTVAISSARFRRRTGSPPPSAVTGGSNINRTGSWMCNVGKLTVGRVATTRPRTWP
jgi:predicted transposase YbfD/YdcC